MSSARKRRLSGGSTVGPSGWIIEVGLHKGLDTLDTVPLTLLEIAISDHAQVDVVGLGAIPSLHWLQLGVVSAAGVRRHAAGTHPLVVLPSVVSAHAWKLLIAVALAVKLFKLLGSQHFALNRRLNPTASAPRKAERSTRVCPKANGC